MKSKIVDWLRALLPIVGLIAILGSQVAVFAQSTAVIQQQLQDYMRTADGRLAGLEGLRDHTAQSDVAINGRLSSLETQGEATTFYLRGIAIAVATMLVKDLAILRKQAGLLKGMGAVRDGD